MALDFVVGGIPRSGTTFFSLLLNLHEDCCCYAETGLFRLVRMLGERPLPPCHIDTAERLLREALAYWLLEHPVVYAGSIEAYQAIADRFFDRNVLFPRFSEADLDTLLAGALSALRHGLYGKPLLAAASGLWADILRRNTGKSVVGDKTPDNIFSCHPNMFAMIREPFATIRSMTRRGTEPNSPFSPDFLPSLGQYLESLSFIQKRNIAAFKYEELVSDPEPILARVFSQIGLRGKSRHWGAARALRGKPPTTPSDFSPIERSMAAAVLHPVIDGLYPIWPGTVTGECPEQIALLYGVSDGRMERRAAYLATTRKRHVAFDLWSRFPHGLANEITLSATVNGHLLGRLTVGPVDAHSALTLDLDEAPKRPVGRNGFGYLIELESSAAFRPIGYARLGPDFRETSFTVKSASIR